MALKSDIDPLLFMLDCDTYISTEATNEPQEICGGGGLWPNEICVYKTI